MPLRILPVRREILLSILYCDLIGFHTYDYARHFLSSCTRILGLPTMPNGVEFEGRLAHVGTFPIGIEPASFIDVCLCLWLDFIVHSTSIEPEEGNCPGPHNTIRTAIRWRESYRWCRPSRLHQGCAAETARPRALPHPAPRMDRQGSHPCPLCLHAG